MSHSAHFSIEILREIKHWDSQDQVSMLLESLNHFLHLSAKIRDAIESLSGEVVVVNLKVHDRKVVLLALLAVLADDIATLPDAQLRAKSMLLHEEVVRGLGLAMKDAEFFRLNLKSFAPFLVG